MLPHNAPYALRQIMTSDPEVSATPGVHAEKLVYDVAKEKAAEQAEAEVSGRRRSLREMALAEEGRQFDKSLGLKESQFDKSLGLKESQFEKDFGLKQSELQLKQEQQDYLNEQRNRATIFAGISAGLNLAGAWWQTKKLDEVIAKYTGQMGYIEERVKNINALIGRQMESIPDQDEIDAAAKGKMRR